MFPKTMKTVIVFFMFYSFVLLSQTQPLVMIQNGHRGIVYTKILSPDSNYIATSGEDNLIKIWDFQTKKLMHSITVLGITKNMDDRILLRFSPDSKQLISTVQIRKKISDEEFVYPVQVWDVVSGKNIAMFKHPEMYKVRPMHDVTISSDGKKIFTIDAWGRVDVWDAKKGSILKTKKIDVYKPTFSPYGTYLAAVNSKYDSVFVYSVESGELVYSANSKSSSTSEFLTPTVFSYDESMLRVFASRSERTFTDITVAEKKIVGTGSLNKDPRSNLFPQKVLELTDLQEEFRKNNNEDLSSIVVSPDEAFVAFGNNGVLSIVDFSTGKQTVTTLSLLKKIYGLSLNSDAVLLAGGSEKKLFIHNVPSLTLQDTFSLPYEIQSTCWIPNSDEILIGTREMMLYRYNYRERRIVSSWKIDRYRFQAIVKISVTPDSKTALVLASHYSGMSAFQYYEWSTTVSRVPIFIDLVSGKEIMKEKYKEFYQEDNGKKRHYKNFTEIHGGSFALSKDRSMMLTGEYSGGIYFWDLKKKEKYNRSGHRQQILSLALSPDDKVLASSGEDNVIILREPRSHRVIHTIINTGEPAYTIEFTRSGKYLIAYGRDNAVRWIETKNWKTVFTVLPQEQGKSFAIIADDNYYWSAKQGIQNIHFLQNGSIFAFDQFDLQYNRPDLLLKKFGKAPYATITAFTKAYEKRLKKMGFTPANFEKERSLNIPVITLSNVPKSISGSSNGTIIFSIKAGDKQFLLDRLLIDVNGIPLYGVRGLSLKDKSTKQIEKNISLQLSQGKNNIKVSVMNEKGVESLAERFELSYIPAVRKPSNLYVISIGVSSFKQSEYNLTYADKDANDIVALLKTQQGKKYEKVFTYQFSNQQAIRENILRVKEELSKSSVYDEVIFFAASHGLLDDELDYYIATHDIDFANPQLRGLRYDELEDLLDGIPARNKIMLLDACHSGEVDKEENILAAANTSTSGEVKARGFKVVKAKANSIGLANSFELMKELFADLRRNNGAVVISSASGKEYALESGEWKNGVFTYSILEGLKNNKCDLNNDRSTTVTELREYVSKKVQELTNGKQNPTGRSENLENDFKVW